MPSLYPQTTVYIYGLCCPLTDAIRYVGKSDNPQRRLVEHLAAARNDRRPSHLRAWLRQLSRKGLRPGLRIIHECPVHDWERWEQFWIEELRRGGCDLVNGNGGGVGGGPPTPEVRHKMARAARKRALDPEYRERQATWMREVWSRPGHREKLAGRIGPKPGSKNPHEANRVQDFIITTPEGEEIEVTNLCAWATARGLKACSFYQVLSGRTPHFRGYKIRFSDQPAPAVPEGGWKTKADRYPGRAWIITTPGGEEIAVRNLAEWCQERGLQSSCFSSVAVGRRKSYHGYKARWAD